MNSFKLGILKASTTESKVKRKLELVRILIARSSSGSHRRNAVEEGWVKHLSESSLICSNVTKLQRRTVNGTLRNVSSDNGRRILILSKGSASRLVGRAISAYIVEAWFIVKINTVTIPSICGHNAVLSIYCLLPERHHLHTNSIDLHLIKQLSNSVILRHGRQNTNGAQGISARKCSIRERHNTPNTILQAEPSDISLGLHTGKLHLRRTTSAVETRAPVPSVGTASSATITTVNHSREW